MQQIVEAVANTCMKLAQHYGPWVACAVLLVIVAGVGLKVVARLLRRNPSRPPA
jgi:hypothetical protein